ncbi:unnamed protein product [Paramecium sonneborni]|uniref:Uncharacterized protein n=1 Tax=Paramecium sonneborni TaxID=65129 RepID=A0A8S1QBP6_9CILI|nr:unnamed protein product [Paramecium sonneborni]
MQDFNKSLQLIKLAKMITMILINIIWNLENKRRKNLQPLMTYIEFIPFRLFEFQPHTSQNYSILQLQILIKQFKLSQYNNNVLGQFIISPFSFIIQFLQNFIQIISVYIWCQINIGINRFYRHKIFILQSQQIFQSPLNNSPSKNQFIFSKSERFVKFADPIFCYQAFYNLDPMIQKRSAGLVKAKTDFPKVVVPSPSPQKYNLGNDVQNNLKKNKGYRVNKDKMANKGILETLNLKTQVKTNPFDQIASGIMIQDLKEAILDKL